MCAFIKVRQTVKRVTETAEKGTQLMWSICGIKRRIAKKELSVIINQ